MRSLLTWTLATAALLLCASCGPPLVPVTRASQVSRIKTQKLFGRPGPIGIFSNLIEVDGTRFVGLAELTPGAPERVDFWLGLSSFCRMELQATEVGAGYRVEVLSAESPGSAPRIDCEKYLGTHSVGLEGKHLKMCPEDPSHRDECILWKEERAFFDSQLSMQRHWKLDEAMDPSEILSTSLQSLDLSALAVQSPVHHVYRSRSTEDFPTGLSCALRIGLEQPVPGRFVMTIQLSLPAGATPVVVGAFMSECGWGPTESRFAIELEADRMFLSGPMGALAFQAD